MYKNNLLLYMHYWFVSISLVELSLDFLCFYFYLSWFIHLGSSYAYSCSKLCYLRTMLLMAILASPRLMAPSDFKLVSTIGQVPITSSKEGLLSVMGNT